MNKIILIGYIGGEPEIRLTKDSDPVCSFRVATNEKYSGDKEHTEWFSVVTFGKTALYCSKNVSKGSRIYVEGKLRTEAYKDSSGVSRITLKVFASELTILEHAKPTANEPLILTLQNCLDTDTVHTQND